MAEPADINVDELRRRARRRLVGAVVLALGVAVIVPMLLETEQKPLGEDVSVKIPPVDEGRFVNRLTDKGEKGASDTAAASSAAPPASSPAPAAAGAERSSKYDTHAPESTTSDASATSATERAGAPSATPSAASTSSRIAPANIAPERAAATSTSAAKAGEAAKGTAPTAKAATESTTGTTASTKTATESTKAANESTKAPTESTKAPTESTKAASEPARVAAAAASSTTAAGKAPATPAHGHDAFAVQLAAFSDNKGANALAGRLKRAGYAAYTEPLKTSKGTLWRVRVGPYPSRETAAAARDKLKTEGQSGIVAPVTGH